MAKVVLIGLEQATAYQIGRALDNEKHQVEFKPKTASVDDVIHADIVFAGGDGKQYLSLLKGVRKSRPS